MKVISVLDQTSRLADGTVCRHTRLYADSAVGRDSMPLFLPELPVKMVARVCPAFRISRLGKHISEKFALRYFDAVGAVCMLDFVGDDADSAKIVQSGAAALYDGMITTGRWEEQDLTAYAADRAEGPATEGASAIAADASMTMCVGDSSVSLGAICRELPLIMSQVSALTTLKSGDMLLMPTHSIAVPAERNTWIRAGIGGKECLAVKVK